MYISIMQPFDFFHRKIYRDHKCFIRFPPSSVRRFQVSFYLIRTDISRNYQHPILLYILWNEAFEVIQKYFN